MAQRNFSGAPLADNLICFAAMALWAVGFPAAQSLLESWGVLALIALRMSLGAILLLAFWRIVEGPAALRASRWRAGLSVGAIGFGAGAALLLAGQAASGPVTAAVMVAMTPVAGALLEMARDRRRPSARLVVGAALAVAGGLYASGVDPSEAGLGLGAGLLIASVVIYSWGTLETNRRMAGETSLARTAVTSVGAALFCIAAFAVMAALGDDSARIGRMGAGDLGLLLVYTIPAFAISQALWLWSAGRLGILLASLHMNAVPFYVMLVSVLTLGSEWSERQALGAAIVAAGVMAAQLRPRAPQAPRRQAAPR